MLQLQNWLDPQEQSDLISLVSVKGIQISKNIFRATRDYNSRIFSVKKKLNTPSTISLACMTIILLIETWKLNITRNRNSSVFLHLKDEDSPTF